MTDEPENTAGRNTIHTLAGASDFPTTRWTLVVAAGRPPTERGSLGFSFSLRELLVSVIRVCSSSRLSFRPGAGPHAGVFHTRTGRPIP